MHEKNITIMVVDDHESVRKTLSLFLEREGYRVISSPGGKEALMRLAAEEIDLLITDYHMPEMNGLELARQLRATPHHRQIPIVMMTADIIKANKQTAEKLDIQQWLTKPFIYKEVLEIAGALNHGTRDGKANLRSNQAHGTYAVRA